MCVVGGVPWNLGGPRGWVCVWGGRDAEGRLQASLMVLVGENRCGRGVNTGGWVVRDVGEDFNVSVAGGRVWGRRGEECSRIGSM